MNTTFILISYENITGVISKILIRIKIYDNKTFLPVHNAVVLSQKLAWVGIIVISHTSRHMLCRTLFIPLLYCKCLPGKSA